MVGDYMAYILGALFTVVFFILLSLSFLIGYKLGKRNKNIETPVASEEERLKAERISKSFTKLMNYDVQTAVARKKVN